VPRRRLASGQPRLDAILGGVLAGVALGVAWMIERFHPTLPASARHRLRLDPAS